MCIVIVRNLQQTLPTNLLRGPFIWDLWISFLPTPIIIVLLRERIMSVNDYYVKHISCVLG